MKVEDTLWNRCFWEIARRAKERGETEIQKSILDFLDKHPDVAWSTRMNNGMATAKGSRVRFAFKGISDIIGQMSRNRNGVMLAIEVKGKSGHATPEQIAFLEKVNRNGGIAGICRSVEDVMEMLK